MRMSSVDGIIASKRATHRSKDLVALERLEKTRDEKRRENGQD